MNINIILGCLWAICAALNTVHLVRFIMQEQIGMTLAYIVCVGLDVYLSYGYFKKAKTQ